MVDVFFPFTGGTLVLFLTTNRLVTPSIPMTKLQFLLLQILAICVNPRSKSTCFVSTVIVEESVHNTVLVDWVYVV